MKTYTFRAEYEDGTFEIIHVDAESVYAAMNEAHTASGEEPSNLSWLTTRDHATQRYLAS